MQLYTHLGVSVFRASLRCLIYSTSFRKDLHPLLNEKRYIQKMNAALFISGWSPHRQISSEHLVPDITPQPGSAHPGPAAEVGMVTRHCASP